MGSTPTPVPIKPKHMKVYFVFFDNGANQDWIARVGSERPVHPSGDFGPYGRVIEADRSCLNWAFLKASRGYQDLVNYFNQ